MADFIAVPNGNGATGYMIANGQVYPAASGGGPNGLLSIPEGKWTYGGPEALTHSKDPKKDQWRSMTDKGDPKGYNKFHIGTGPNGSGTLPDPRRPKKPREGVEFHFDGGSTYGTAGCIGYQDNAARQALIDDPNKSVSVKYVKDEAAMKAEIERRLGHSVDWSKVKKPGQAGTSRGGGSGTHSQTKKGNKVKPKKHNVHVGPKQRHIAHRQASLMSGGKVVQGLKKVAVGRPQYQVARVDHLTTDGSPVADGESSVLGIA
jgi:hypothetical protein